MNNIFLYLKETKNISIKDKDRWRRKCLNKYGGVLNVSKEIVRTTMYGASTKRWFIVVYQLGLF